MKNQFEQHCNAAALQEMGIPVIKSLKKKHLDNIKLWLQSELTVSVNYPDLTEQLIDSILTTHLHSKKTVPLIPVKRVFSVKKFRELSLKKILIQLAG